MRKVKPDITIESRPGWMVTLFFAGYDLAFIQCYWLFFQVKVEVWHIKIFCILHTVSSMVLRPKFFTKWPNTLLDWIQPEILDQSRQHLT
jgi:hypothetical protein